MITIIGGGFSGIAAAYFLHRAGKDVTLFERSRGLGGRATTHNLAYRTVDVGTSHLDFSTTDNKQEAEARELLRTIAAERGALPWLKPVPGPMFKFDGRSIATAKPVEQSNWFYLDGGMTALAEALLVGIPVRTHSRISSIELDGKKVSLKNQRGETTESETIVIATTAPVALKLLEPHIDESRNIKKLCAQLGEVRYEPMLSAVFGVARMKLKQSFSVIYSEDATAPIAFLTREQKRRRLGFRKGENAFHLQMGAELSREYSAKGDSEALAMIERVFEEVLDIPLTDIMYSEINRWQEGTVVSTPFKGGDVQKVKLGVPVYAIGDFITGSSSIAQAVWAGKLLADEILGTDSFVYIADPKRTQEELPAEKWNAIVPPEKAPRKPKGQSKQKDSKRQELKKKLYKKRKQQMKRMSRPGPGRPGGGGGGFRGGGRFQQGPPRGGGGGGYSRGPSRPPQRQQRVWDERRGMYIDVQPQFRGPRDDRGGGGGGYDRGGGGGYNRGGGDRPQRPYQQRGPGGGGGYDRGGGGGGGYNRGGGGGGGYDRGGGGGGGYNRGGGGGGGYNRGTGGGGGGYNRGGGGGGGYDRGGGGGGGYNRGGGGGGGYDRGGGSGGGGGYNRGGGGGGGYNRGPGGGGGGYNRGPGGGGGGYNRGGGGGGGYDRGGSGGGGGYNRGGGGGRPSRPPYPPRQNDDDDNRGNRAED